MTETIGFIGFGEAAYWISKGLKAETPTKVTAFDINQDHPDLGAKITKRAQEVGVPLAEGLEELIDQSTIIISSTSAKYAVDVAKSTVPHLKEHQLYADINAASPMVKEEVSLLLEKKASFVDVAVMESIPNFKHKVSLLLSGDGACRFKRFGDEQDMNMKVINERPGSASAIKMVRSIFMKGFTMLLLETLVAGRAHGIDDFIMTSIEQSITKKPLRDTADNLLTRTANHAARRVAEMEEVVRTLNAADVDALLSQATKDKLNLLVDQNIMEHFHFETPENYEEVIDFIYQQGR